MESKKKQSLAVRMGEMEKMVSNLQMAVNISQALLKRVNDMGGKLDMDITNAMGIINDLQYRTLSMMENGNFDKAKLDETADNLKLVDFQSASDKEDEAKGFFSHDNPTTEDDIVIITSTTDKDYDAGIFRSKLAIKDAVLPDLKEKLVGKIVGDSFKTDVTRVVHEIPILGVRGMPVVA